MPGTSDLDWDDLRYFLAAVRAKTLAGAARSLGIEHTTVGRRLSALEQALGAPLVLRGPDGLRPTPLAERLVPWVEQMERAVASVRELAQSDAERVRLAVPSGFARLFVSAWGALRAAHPRVVLEIVSGARVVDLERCEADLAVRGAPVADAELIARTLCRSGWSLYASRDYLARCPAPVELLDLRGHDVIGYDASLGRVPAAEWVEARAATARIVLRSREMTDMLAAVLGGVGLGLLPCVLADAEASLVRLTPEVLATRTLSLVYRREMRLSEPVRAVIDFVFDVVRQHEASIEGRSPAGAPKSAGPARPAEG